MKKAAELSELTIEELKQEVMDLKKELFNLRFQRTTGEIENPMRIRQVKRHVARVTTVITKKLKANG